jgi:hypothetical protein
MPESRIARLLADLVGRLPAIVPTVGLYAAGSLGTRDFEPDRSDLDIVAVLEHSPSEDELRAIRGMHRDLAREHPAGNRLHCLYVAVDEIGDSTHDWPYWAQEKWGSGRFTAITRLELHDHGVVVAGPPVAARIPYVTPEELADDVRAELSTVWLPATEKVSPWLDDAMVDIGLTALPRAHAAITEGVLLSKTQAIAQLSEWEVPDWVRQDMLARRRGWVTTTGRKFRSQRARVVRDAVRRGVERLLAEPVPPVDGGKPAED